MKPVDRKSKIFMLAVFWKNNVESNTVDSLFLTD